MTEGKIAIQEFATERLGLVCKIVLILLGDALIFAVWCFIDFALHGVSAYVGSHGVASGSPATWFLLVAEWFTFLVAVGYILCDLIGVSGEVFQLIRFRWHPKK